MPSRWAEHTLAVSLLAGGSPAERRAHLVEHSGLPGPRANLPLAQAYAEVADVDEAVAFAAGDDEYLALCGAIALAARAGDPAVADRAQRIARDARRRVREGVVHGLQRLAAVDAAAFLAVLDGWRADPDPLVQRARVAALCEPALLRDPLLAEAALEACAEATALLRRLPAGERRRTDVRVLRKALGSCWSAAIAADPAAGLPAFEQLVAETDPDVAWIVRENRRKARLRRLLDRG